VITIPASSSLKRECIKQWRKPSRRGALPSPPASRHPFRSLMINNHYMGEENLEGRKQKGICFQSIRFISYFWFVLNKYISLSCYLNVIYYSDYTSTYPIWIVLNTSYLQQGGVCLFILNGDKFKRSHGNNYIGIINSIPWDLHGIFETTRRDRGKRSIILEVKGKKSTKGKRGFSKHFLRSISQSPKIRIVLNSDVSLKLLLNIIGQAVDFL